MKKSAISLIAIVLVFSFVLTCPALASGSSAESLKNADALYSLGLFKGTGSGYDLDSPPTRIQGLIMLIRLLGEEQAALSFEGKHNLKDVPPWADKYVSYGLYKGYTKGTGAESFSPDDVIDGKSYVTFLLRALGYNDAAGDFSWNAALSDSAGFGLISPSAASSLSTAPLNRGDMVDLSFCALTCPLKAQSISLAEKLVSAGVFTKSQGDKNGVLSGQLVYNYVPYDSSTISYEKKTVAGVTADIITVNLNNSRVSVKSALVSNTIGATAPFSSIVSQSGAAAVINANFFEAYESFKIPIGHIMSNGQFVYGVSGLSSFGFTEDNKVVAGRPAFFFNVAVEGNEVKKWPCYELNSIAQTYSNSVIYTPAYGSVLNIKTDATAVTITNGRVSSVSPCYAGDSLSIPEDGYILWLGGDYTSTSYYTAPEIGDKVSLTPYLFKADEEGFSAEGLKSLISGAPRLVKGSAIETYLDEGFSEARFTTASTPRTAVGTLPDGKLVLVSVQSATIQKMREMMHTLGCVDAINMDGGASTAMYYKGSYIRSSGRNLTATLQVFVD
ncbi:MAG: phosphodiester glycosidase family protein [Clostridiales bacterium]|nr:phosphodiester glycosidase family protein [Clostridiales bacterium]